MNPIAIVIMSFTLMFGTTYAAVTFNPNQTPDKGAQNAK